MRTDSTWRRPSPQPVSTASRFFITWCVCASMPSGYGASAEVPGNGICPVTKTQPSASTAWLNGATGSGAPAIMWKIGDMAGLRSVRLADQLEVFHHRRHREVGADDGAPLREQRATAEVDGVVIERVPEDLQDVALGRLDALVDLVAAKALGLAD